jgi:hypothetical protein
MSPDDAGRTAQDERRERLAASLRENLKRRKTQQRSRASELQRELRSNAQTSSCDPKG